MSKKRTLSEAAEQGGKLICPYCHCEHFEVYGHGQNERQRYKRCRNCKRFKVLIRTTEEVIRVIESKDDDDSIESILFSA